MINPAKLIDLYRYLLLLLGLTIMISCKPEPVQGKYQDADQENIEVPSMGAISLSEEDSILSNDVTYINTVLLKGIHKMDLTPYDLESCMPIKRGKKGMSDNFDGIEEIGDLNADTQAEYVWVLPPLSYCEDGESYYFSDSSLGRITTDSYCCNPKGIFSMGDIDEDGVDEIGQYYSSCASRYKSIKVLSFKKGKWISAGDVTFMLNDTYEPFEDFNKLYRKKRRGVVEFLEIADMDLDGKLVTEWKEIKIY